MKNFTITCLLSMTAFCFSNAQTTLFEDDFESYSDFIITGIGNWTTLDLDGLTTYSGGGGSFTNQNAAMAFMIFNPTAAGVSNSTTGELRNFDPYSGAKYAAAWAAVPGTPTANDDWLISPPITLASSGNSLNFYAKALSSSYGNENYTVGIYTGSGTPTGSGDFTIISPGPFLTATYPSWELVTIGLDAYSNQEVRIGIHYISSDVYMLMIDDFSVTTTLSVDEYAFNACQVSCKDKVVTISNNHGEAGFKIYSLTGQTVMEGTTRLESQNIDASNLASGIYVVEVNDSATNAIIKKKIAI